MDFETWLKHGKENDWCSSVICYTHTGPPTSLNEDTQFGDGFDPCIYIVRIYENEDQSASVKDNSKDG